MRLAEIAAPVPVTSTSAFRKWFVGSKVVDTSGHPLMCYHGTHGGPDQHIGRYTHFGTMNAAQQRIAELNDMMDDGIHTRMAAEKKGEHIFRVYLCIKNPMQLDDIGDNWLNEDALTIMAKRGYIHADEAKAHLEGGDDWDDVARELGFDGVFYENGHEDPGHISWYPIGYEKQVWILD